MAEVDEGLVIFDLVLNFFLVDDENLQVDDDLEALLDELDVGLVVHVDLSVVLVELLLDVPGHVRHNLRHELGVQVVHDELIETLRDARQVVDVEVEHLLVPLDRVEGAEQKQQRAPQVVDERLVVEELEDRKIQAPRAQQRAEHAEDVLEGLREGIHLLVLELLEILRELVLVAHEKARKCAEKLVPECEILAVVVLEGPRNMMRKI